MLALVEEYGYANTQVSATVRTVIADIVFNNTLGSIAGGVRFEIHGSGFDTVCDKNLVEVSAGGITFPVSTSIVTCSPGVLEGYNI